MLSIRGGSKVNNHNAFMLRISARHSAPGRSVCADAVVPDRLDFDRRPVLDVADALTSINQQIATNREVARRALDRRFDESMCETDDEQAAVSATNEEASVVHAHVRG